MLGEADGGLGAPGLEWDVKPVLHDGGVHVPHLEIVALLLALVNTI